MFGRFFAIELGCPDEDTYLNEGEVHEGAMMVCECRGLGCKKCKRKKAKTVTLTGGNSPAPVPVMNMARLPLSPWTTQMIMMGKSSIF